MLKLLFLDPPGYQHQGYNLGLAMLCSAVAREGHRAVVFDRNEGGDVEQVVRGFDPDIIGISIKTATFSAGVKLAQQAKAMQPGALVVAGGPHPTIDPADLLNGCPQMDLTIAGEGERAVVELCRRVERARGSFGGRAPSSGWGEPGLLAELVDGLPGVGVRDAGGKVTVQPAALVTDLDALAFPRLEAFINVDAGSRPYHMMTSRGCPFRCAYCSVRSIAGRKLRTRSVESVVEEILFAKACYGVEVFEVDDDNFTLQIERAKMICEALLQRRVNLPWYLPNGIRAEMLDRELADLLARSSCHTVALGIESGDPRVLRAIRKGISPDSVRRAVGMLQDAGIRVMGFFIVGLPGSDLQSDLYTIEYERSLNLDDRIYNAFVPYPSTEGFAWAEQHGRFLGDYRDALHFSDREETVFETEEYPATQRTAALALARLSTKKLQADDFELLRELVLSGLDRDTLLVEVESYLPGLSDIVRRFTPLSVIQVRDRTAMDVRLVDPDGNELMSTPLRPGWQHDLSLTLGVTRALAGRRFHLLMVPKIHAYLALSLTARADNRFQYTYNRELSSVDPGGILVKSPTAFARSRGRTALQQVVPDPVAGVEKAYRAAESVRRLKDQAVAWGRRSRHLPAWLSDLPLTGAVAATSQLGIGALRLRRRLGGRR